MKGLPLFMAADQNLKLIGNAASNIVRFNQLYKNKLQNVGKLDEKELLSYFEFIADECQKILDRDNRLKKMLCSDARPVNQADTFKAYA